MKEQEQRQEPKVTLISEAQFKKMIHQSMASHQHSIDALQEQLEKEEWGLQKNMRPKYMVIQYPDGSMGLAVELEDKGQIGFKTNRK